MSKTLMIAAALAGLPMLMSAAPAAAQPGGSYRQSCTDIRYSGGQLTATCGGLGGGARTTTINASQCRGDIGNNNGVLSCAGATATNVRLEPDRTVRAGGDDGRYGRGGAQNRRTNLDGSFRQTCRDISNNGTLLTATCGTARGGYRTSMLETANCRGGDISNRDGLLVCNGAVANETRGGAFTRDGRNDGRGYNGGGYDNRGPNGGYDNRGYNGGGYNGGGFGGRGAGLTLFSERGFQGRTFDVRSDEDNLGDTGFNDRARSLRVNGGRWRVCADSDFRRCQVVYGDVDDLARIGLSGSISSVQRID